MTVISMVTEVHPKVVLYMPEDPCRFQARISALAAKFLSIELERTSRLGGDSPMANMGRILSAISATETLLNDDFTRAGTGFLAAALSLGDQGEFTLEISFSDNFQAPTHSSIAIN